MELKKLIEEYLLIKARLMQVATAKYNQSWTCSVYFAFDDSLNLYWISKPSRRHSQEIRYNEKVSGTIVLPHTPGDDVRGLQFQGIAKELRDKSEIQDSIQHYAKRYKMPTKRVNAIIEDTNGHLCYCIEPTLFVLFDEVNFPDDPRQEYNLK